MRKIEQPIQFRVVRSTRVAVHNASSSVRALLEGLSHALPISFEFASPRDGAAGGELMMEYTPDSRASASRTFRMLVAGSGRTISIDGSFALIKFGTTNHLDSALRGAVLQHPTPSDLRAVPPNAGDETIATLNGVPIWLRRVDAGYSTETISLRPPELASGESPLDHLHGGNFLRFVPLFHFIKRALADSGWTFPRPRACLMFDDPNLHWESYGFISYTELLRRSKLAPYHVAFATVPLDAWYTHYGTAALFRDNPDRLSLLIHGNNHLYAELARERSASAHVEYMAQGLRRIEKLEGRSAIRVCRTMAPPHGACSNAAMIGMFRTGIEAAYISPWSLRLWDNTRTWPLAFGLMPAESVGSGFAVMPRFKLLEQCQETVRLAALMGRPIVAVGHHQDLRNGPELLDSVATTINQLPDVGWHDTEGLSRSNYLSRLNSAKQTLEVVPFASRMDIPVPEGVSTITLFDRVASLNEGTSHQWRLHDPQTTTNLPVVGSSLPVKGGQIAHISRSGLGEVDIRSLSSPRLSIAASIRRVLCETRDRLLPFAPGK